MSAMLHASYTPDQSSTPVMEATTYVDVVDTMCINCIGGCRGEDLLRAARREITICLATESDFTKKAHGPLSRDAPTLL